MTYSNHDFKIGDYVTCFDYFAVILDVDALSGLLLENPRIGKWYAHPSYCSPYIPTIKGE